MQMIVLSKRQNNTPEDHPATFTANSSGPLWKNLSQLQIPDIMGRISGMQQPQELYEYYAEIVSLLGFDRSEMLIDSGRSKYAPHRMISHIVDGGVQYSDICEGSSPASDDRFLQYCQHNSSSRMWVASSLSGSDVWQEYTLASSVSTGIYKKIVLAIPCHRQFHQSCAVKLLSEDVSAEFARSLSRITPLLCYITPFVTEAIFKRSETGPKQLATNLLTEREINVLHFLGLGYKIADVSRTLDISPNTVCSHTRSIHKKLQVKNRTQAIRKAVDLGLISV